MIRYLPRASWAGASSPVRRPTSDCSRELLLKRAERGVVNSLKFKPRGLKIQDGNKIK